MSSRFSPAPPLDFLIQVCDNQVMKSYALYTTPTLPLHFVARTTKDTWVLVPDIENGWNQRRAYMGHQNGLRLVAPEQGRLAVERLDAWFDLLRPEIDRDDIATID